MSYFSNVELAPRDPILGLNELFNADARAEKVNLGVGVYQDDNGKLPLLACVREAQKQVLASFKPHGYLGIDGLPAYNAGLKALLFDQKSDVLQSGLVVTAQTIGGTGALKIGADFLKKHISPDATVYISDPSWENHRALFSQAGFTVDTYPYYSTEKQGVDVDAMLAKIGTMVPDSILILHACCHNPTGYDVSAATWSHIIELCKERKLIPFLDMAYQGFKQGLEEDRALIQQFVASGLSFLVSSSFSKNFGLYGERVGAISLVCASKDEAARVLSQIKIIIRTNYSNPPTFGASIVASILTNPELFTQWNQEVTDMRDRIKAMRVALVDGLKSAGAQKDMAFITEQVGMFSYSGLSKPQMERLRSEFAIYGTDTGRLNIAALNIKNLGYVCQAIAQVL